MRYDYVYGISVFPLYGKEVKALLCDYSTTVLYSYRNRHDKEWIAEVEYTINQVGKKYYFDLTPGGGPDHALVHYQYPSFNVGLGYDLYQVSNTIMVTTSVTANYIPYGHPAYPGRDFMTLGLSARFRFKSYALSWRL